MEKENDLAVLDKYRFSGPEKFYSKLKKVYQRRILNLEPINSYFEYLNTLSSDGKKYLAIGTESGLIFIFSLKENKFTGSFRGDKWISSMELSQQLLYTSGFSRVIDCYNLRSNQKVLELPQETARQAYGTKGIKFVNTAIKGKVIANVGFGKFKIFDSKKRKTIYSFDISKDSLKEVEMDETSREPTVHNFCVIQKLFKIVYLLAEDDHIYFYNYKHHKLLKKIKLFDYRANIRAGILMVNSLILNQDNFLFVVLQFSDPNSSTSSLTTLLKFIEVSNIGEHPKMQVIFEQTRSRLLANQMT